MKYLFAIVAVLVHATTAAPIPQPQFPDSNANAIVHIRLIGDANQHYSTGDTQIPSAPSGSILSILVGQSLDFPSYAPQLQAIEISRITQGGSLGGMAVSDMDQNVVCKAAIKGISDGSTFSVKDAQVLLDEGRMVKLTGLACWIEPERV
ncbi:Nn.00g033000.m01.CDS01 [Neocucurbitaria sp. VM-36]